MKRKEEKKIRTVNEAEKKVNLPQCPLVDRLFYVPVTVCPSIFVSVMLTSHWFPAVIVTMSFFRCSYFPEYEWL